jgi:hypothetical protein
MEHSKLNGGKGAKSAEEGKGDNLLAEQLREADYERSVLQQRCSELEAQCKQEKEEKNK